MNIICFIPARKGSQRIKNKNILKIKGRPLIYWTVVKALKSKKFHKIIFSSDSKSYYKILLKFLNKDKVRHSILEFDYRNKKHTRTKSKIFDYLKSDLIKKYNFDKKDLIVQMLPTCPLRSINSIKKIIHFSMKYKKNSFSVCEYDFPLSFGISIIKNKWKPISKDSPMLNGNTQSQDQKIYYHPTGSINCIFVKSLKKNIKSIYYKATPIILNRNESFDIDTSEDFKIVSKLIS
jgi:CMP-N-acetylneuraminic acid synthetase